MPVLLVGCLIDCCASLVGRGAEVCLRLDQLLDNLLVPMASCDDDRCPAIVVAFVDVALLFSDQTPDLR